MNVKSKQSSFRPVNPTSLDELGEVMVSTSDQVQNAIEAAQIAFEGDWPRDAILRQSVLASWADQLKDNADELSVALVAETGKPVREARLEVTKAIEALVYNAGLARHVGGRAGLLSDGSEAHLTRYPIGVTAFVVPWNWPVLLLFRDLAPALAAGVTVVVKPSPQTSLVTQRVIELGYAAGLPANVVNLVFGDAEVGQAMVTHKKVAAVAFTGSTSVGREIARLAASGPKRTLLELGGKGASVIFADANLEEAVGQSVASAVITSGQMCMACTRILVEQSVFPEVLDQLVAKVRSLSVGDPAQSGTDLGPLISRAQFDKVSNYLVAARQEGTVVVGGERVQPVGTVGYFITPAIVIGLEPQSSVIQDDIFGPVISVESFGSETAAINLANCTEYGLATAVWTNDVGRAWRVARSVSAGTVWVNGYNRNYPEIAAGGLKASGLGRSRGIEGVEEFTDLKHIHFSLP